MWRLFPFLCLSFALLLTGCSGAGSDRHAVSGTVNFKNKPLEKGTIEFRPVDLNAASPGGGPIDNGRYNIPKDHGLKPGNYIVVISSPSEVKGKVEEVPGESGPPAKELIPADWNVNSKQRVEVKASGPNTFDFEIK